MSRSAEAAVHQKENPRAAPQKVSHQAMRQTANRSLEAGHQTVSHRSGAGKQKANRRLAAAHQTANRHSAAAARRVPLRPERQTEIPLEAARQTAIQQRGLVVRKAMRHQGLQRARQPQAERTEIHHRQTAG